jgi:transposase
MRKACEGCGLKHPNNGMAAEGKKWWCTGCGEAEDAFHLKTSVS